MIHFEKKFLDNGLRIIVAPMKNTEAITLLVLIGTGSRYETKKTQGISHLLEHMVFKGTKDRPRPGQISKELDKIGAHHNAFTSKENTGFWVKSSTENFDTILEIISDILLNPLFKNEELKKEQKTIIEEINMCEDEPQRKVLTILENILYPKQPLGWDILGTKESIIRLKKTDILEYKNKNYLSGNIVIAIAGNIDQKGVFKKIEKKFKRIKKARNKPPEKVKIFQKQPQLKITEKDLDQTHFFLAVRGYNMFDEKKYKLDLLSIILGGNMSSRLVMEIREKLGLAYYINSWGVQFLDCGYLGIRAGVSCENLKKTITKIVEICKNIKEKLSLRELSHAKSFIRGQMALSFETSEEIASFLAHQELFYKKILQPEEILKKIEKINQNDILKTAKDIFKSQKINLAIIGPQVRKKEELLKKILLRI